MKFSDLVQTLGLSAHPSAQHSLTAIAALDPEITEVAAIQTATAGSISYVEGDKYASYVDSTQASALILPLNPDLQARAIARNIAWIATPEPRLTFAQTIACFYQPFQPEPEIHPTAVIHPTARLGQGVYIGPHVAVQAQVIIGDGVCIHPNVVIYPAAQIGDRTVLHANCVIHERAQIGRDCVIHAGAVVGSEGFGFVPSAQGLVKMHQSGQVILDDNVEVGCNSAIDRPAIGVTRIGRNTKIDNLVQIGHGCQVGQSCALSAQAGMAGRVRLGNGVILAGQVGISNDVTMGDRAIATAQAGLHRDVEPGMVVSGTPAIPNKLWLKVTAVYNRLPELYQTLRQLQR